MLKKTTPALLLLFIATASALGTLALIAIGLAGGTLAGVIGSYFLGIKPLQEDIDKLQELNDMLNETLTKEFNIAKSTIEYTAETDSKIYSSTFLLIEDMQTQTEPYAWTLAKYTAVKRLKEELNNGTDFTTALGYAKQDAMDTVRNYYINVTNNSVITHNMFAERYIAMARAGLQSAMDMLQSDCADGDGCSQWTSYSVVLPDYCDQAYQFIAMYDGANYVYGIAPEGDSPSAYEYTIDAVVSVQTETKTTTNLGNFTLKKSVSGTGIVVPCMTKINAIIDNYDAEFSQISANLDVYLDSLTDQIVSEVNLTEILDPVTLATQINNDAETTGYYGYAAAELALLGLNLTGLNKTITIDVNGTELNGILFTDWSGTLYAGGTYYADPAYLWYLVDENGQLYDIAGQNFTVANITDKDGNALSNTTFVKYVDHSGDIQKLYDELLKLTKLYEDYIEMQTVSGGGISELGDWWASLSDTEKVAIAVVGVVVIIALARK